jgi:osmoprotectant transport system permease protein
MSLAPRNRVLFVLALAVIVATAFLGFLSIAPNRLISGRALTLAQIADDVTLLMVGVLGLALLAMSFVASKRPVQVATLGLAGLLLLLLLFEAGHHAAALMNGAPPATRIGLGPAFWVALFCLTMAILDALQRLGSTATMRLGVLLALLLPLAAMAIAGTFDQLSIAREYASRQGVFAAALLRHTVLVLASVGAALAIGAPLGVLIARKPAAGSAVFGTLNLLQTVPSVALFGLLIVPLAALASAIPALGALGVGGIGPAPAIVALVLYALLPIVRNTQAGIGSVDPAIVDTAQGMGFTPAQIFWRVELPLAMPTFLAGLRIVLVQSIGLAAVAALIGAGGLGTFIFQGIGQYATDLVLLGAIPIILSALAADFSVTIATQTIEGKKAA